MRVAVRNLGGSESIYTINAYIKTELTGMTPVNLPVFLFSSVLIQESKAHEKLYILLQRAQKENGKAESTNLHSSYRLKEHQNFDRTVPLSGNDCCELLITLS